MSGHFSDFSIVVMGRGERCFDLSKGVRANESCFNWGTKGRQLWHDAFDSSNVYACVGD